MLPSVTRPDKLGHMLRQAVGFYWGSGLSNEAPALAWFLLASLVPLALGITALAAVVGVTIRVQLGHSLGEPSVADSRHLASEGQTKRER